ncbi:MAG: ribokinase [Verrucomicrobiae bacterium]|nr:ribokinase [Verrucomicrobiae bacterium]
MKRNIVVLGSLNTDLVVSGSSLPRPGETVTGGRFFQAHGGKGANQAVAAKRLAPEADVLFLGAVGDDGFGLDARAALAGEGIDVSRLLKAENSATGIALIMVDASGTGENMISVASGANAAVDSAFVDSVEAAIFESAQIFLTSLEIGFDAVRCGLERARSHGVFTIVNPAPAMAENCKAIVELLPLVDLLIPNSHEARSLCREIGGASPGESSPSHLAKWLSESNPASAIVITLGESGCLVREVDGSECRLPAQPAGTVADTTGAGDCFCGAVAAELAQGSSLRNACNFAIRAAGICVTRLGAQPSIPTRAELE